MFIIDFFRIRGPLCTPSGHTGQSLFINFNGIVVLYFLIDSLGMGHGFPLPGKMYPARECQSLYAGYFLLTKIFTGYTQSSLNISPLMLTIVSFTGTRREAWEAAILTSWERPPQQGTSIIMMVMVFTRASSINRRIFSI